MFIYCVSERQPTRATRTYTHFPHTTLLQSYESVAHSIIQQFRELGAQIHLDDFGTGYYSLSQLARLPLDVIKLDHAFITTINENSTSQALVRSMVAVDKQMKLQVVAEGGETQNEAEFLIDIRVDVNKGYVYDRPMTAGGEGKVR